MEFMDLFFFLHAISGFYRRGYTMDYGSPAKVITRKGGRKYDIRISALSAFIVLYLFRTRTSRGRGMMRKGENGKRV